MISQLSSIDIFMEYIIQFRSKFTIWERHSRGRDIEENIQNISCNYRSDCISFQNKLGNTVSNQISHLPSAAMSIIAIRNISKKNEIFKSSHKYSYRLRFFFFGPILIIRDSFFHIQLFFLYLKKFFSVLCCCLFLLLLVPRLRFDFIVSFTLFSLSHTHTFYTRIAFFLALLAREISNVLYVFLARCIDQSASYAFCNGIAKFFIRFVLFFCILLRMRGKAHTIGTVYEMPKDHRWSTL